MNNDKAISTLNGLIETCKDGEQGFRTAADGLTDPLTKSQFQNYSRDRALMARELQEEVRRLGGDPTPRAAPPVRSTVAGSTSKSVVTGKDDASIIAEAERGEDAAKRAYDDALRAELPGTALTLCTAAGPRAGHPRSRQGARAGHAAR